MLAAGAALFATVDEAAVAALAEAMAARPAKHEHAGVVYRCGDGYGYTAPQRGGRIGFRLAVDLPKGARLAALYHTHPVAFMDWQFSEHDTEVAAKMLVPSFVGVVRYGRVIALDPGAFTVGVPTEGRRVTEEEKR
jgi:hypothetical protein